MSEEQQTKPPPKSIFGKIRNSLSISARQIPPADKKETSPRISGINPKISPTSMANLVNGKLGHKSHKSESDEGIANHDSQSSVGSRNSEEKLKSTSTILSSNSQSTHNIVKVSSPFEHGPQGVGGISASNPNIAANLLAKEKDSTLISVKRKKDPKAKGDSQSQLPQSQSSLNGSQKSLSKQSKMQGSNEKLNTFNGTQNVRAASKPQDSSPASPFALRPDIDSSAARDSQEKPLQQSPKKIIAADGGIQSLISPNASYAARASAAATSAKLSSELWPSSSGKEDTKDSLNTRENRVNSMDSENTTFGTPITNFGTPSKMAPSNDTEALLVKLRLNSTIKVAGVSQQTINDPQNVPGPRSRKESVGAASLSKYDPLVRRAMTTSVVAEDNSDESPFGAEVLQTAPLQSQAVKPRRMTNALQPAKSISANSPFAAPNSNIGTSPNHLLQHKSSISNSPFANSTKTANSPTAPGASRQSSLESPAGAMLTRQQSSGPTSLSRQASNPGGAVITRQASHQPGGASLIRKTSYSSYVEDDHASAISIKAVALKTIHYPGNSYTALEKQDSYAPDDENNSQEIYEVKGNIHLVNCFPYGYNPFELNPGWETEVFLDTKYNIWRRAIFETIPMQRDLPLLVPEDLLSFLYDF